MVAQRRDIRLPQGPVLRETRQLITRRGAGTVLIDVEQAQQANAVRYLQRTSVYDDDARVR